MFSGIRIIKKVGIHRYLLSIRGSIQLRGFGTDGLKDGQRV
jgi:hypothetical protein